ncbi:MAG: cytochrome P450 [Actinomycetota bacterium]
MSKAAAWTKPGLPLAMPPVGSGLAPVFGDPGPPIVGYTFKFLRDPLAFGHNLYDRFGQVTWVKAFGTKLVLLMGPDSSSAVLLNRDKAYSNGRGWEYFIGPFFNRGLMLLDFDEHLYHRRIMQAAFTNERLAAYLAGMNEGIARDIAAWQPRDGFHVLPALKQLTLGLATETFMGVAPDEAADRVNRAFIDTVRAGTSFVRFPVPGGRWWRGLRGRKVLEGFLTGYLPEKRAGRGDDLFSVLCHAASEEGETFTDTDIVNHMIFLLMAAHDTSTITTSSIAYYLAKHPEWQERVRAESLALGKEQLDFDDIEKLASLDLVMKEALRLIAPVPALARRTVKDVDLLGHFIPAGTLVSAGIGYTHHIEEYWPDPERFDPERFADHRREDKIHPHAWEPFGTGAHKCIGLRFGSMEIKAIVHQVVQRFRWSVPEDYEMPIDTTALPVPADGLPVKLEAIAR